MVEITAPPCPDRAAVALAVNSGLREKGGVAVLALALAREWAGQRPVVLTSRDTVEITEGHAAYLRLPDFSDPEGLREWAQRLRERQVRILFFHLAHTYDFELCRRVSRPLKAVREVGIMAVLVNHYGAATLRWHSDKPWARMPLRVWRRAVRRHHMRQVFSEIAVSDHEQQALSKYFKAPYAQWRRIYHAVWNPEDRGAEPAFEDRRQTLLCVGHIARRKGQDVLARAFDCICSDWPDWTLDIIGPVAEPDVAADIEALPAARAGRIRLSPPCDDVIEHMRRCGLFVLPSRSESLGLALQEALAVGAPCLASRIGGPEELISEGKTGMFFNAGDVHDLRNVMEQLLKRPEWRRDLGRNAYREMPRKQMTAKAMIEQYNQFIREALK